jgi:CubicO group peptidase (beta-lactamase class C family)
MNPSEFAQKIDTIATEQSFSGVISIVWQNQTIFENAFGYADRSNKLENQVSTRFGIASGTKFLTALAIGKLIDAKKLTLETKLKDCLAHPFPNYSPDITIGQLLNHTSGIADYYDEEKITDFDNFALSVPSYELKTLQNYLPTFPDEPMKFAPGERFSYCNGGFIVLGLVVEELTGIGYQQYVQQAILEPIGLGQSGFFWLNQLPENTALGYLDDANGWRSNIYNLPIVGGSDGGMFTTLQDLKTLWAAFLNHQILSKELTERYSQPSVKAESAGENLYYGYGLWIFQENQHQEVYMLGGDAGVSFRSGVQPASNLQRTIISNTTDGVWGIRKEVDAAMRLLTV